MKSAPTITLTDGDREGLSRWSRGRRTPVRLMQRAKIVLLAAQGRMNKDIAAELDLIAAGLFIDNGQPFDYKKFSVSAIAPAGTAFVRARASMINAMANPAGGGQALVMDDFELVPEPTTMGLLLLGAATLRRRVR